MNNGSPLRVGGGLSPEDAGMAADVVQDDDGPQHLKQVSRIKHIILQKYLPSWEVILGSKNRRLCYFDCYAGPGAYEFEGQKVDGSPIIAVRAAQEYLAKVKAHQMTVILVEKDEKQRASLDTELKRVQPYGQGLQVHVMAEDVKEFVPKLLGQVPNLAPSFFMVDPYGHPLTVPILNGILQRPQTEALINFMYYRINMDAGNAKVQHHLDAMFGDGEWRTQAFLRGGGWNREQGFLEYFKCQIKAQYKLQFRIRCDVEDGVAKSRTKYYLIHASNHPKAALLMKEVMWPLGDEEGLFDFSGEKHGMLFSSSPREEELRRALLQEYSGKEEVEFDQLREETWDLPFIEKHYRSVVKQLKEEDLVEITPVSSKTDRGLKKKDRVRFLPPKEGGSI
ncbi:MAG: three-Cys-motif partner protein TcmP [Bryobacteraceae bacterium]|nr:three-Cys-motif partner protein TcmP [Bryobacteraceae bacterium]